MLDSREESESEVREDRKRLDNINDLARRMHFGEAEAYVEFADYFGPRFMGIFIGRGLTRSEAEELAILCVTDIVLKLDRYEAREDADFADWVFALARNELANWWRARQLKVVPTVTLDGLLTAQLTPQSTSPGEATVRNTEVQEAVDDGLARLSEQGRDIILLHTTNGYTHAEIAEMLRIPAGNVRAIHFRALKKLKAILEEDTRIRKHMLLDTTLTEAKNEDNDEK